MLYAANDGLATISQNGEIPKTRMRDARQTQDFAKRLSDNDTKRAWKRSRVNGLVQGNPPYKLSKLKEAGRSDACNVNWNISRSYLENGTGAFYDLTSEAAGFVKIHTSFGDPEQRENLSRVLSEEADEVIRNDRVWDYEMQQSQNNMVLHGRGPFVFEDNYCIFPRAFCDGDLKVPEFTYADTHYWEACAVYGTYWPPQLFEFIEDAESAKLRGWNVDYTKRVIANAMGIQQNIGVQYEWEFYQQELKNNALFYLDDALVCKVVHLFWKEFDGRISHAIVERETTVGTGLKLGQKAVQEKDQDIQFLFRHVGRYRDWDECVHPMYFDRGDGGYHHSVTGLGVKMFGAMEWQNRALCNLADKSFSAKTLFKPTTAESSQKFQLTRLGDFDVLPGGFEVVQNPLNGFITEGLAMNKEITDIVSSNLSAYRQQVEPKMGNPVTAKQYQMEASERASLSKPTYNRYYRQLDFLYAEIVRRMCDLNTTDPRAQQFQKRCQEKGVPRECFGRIDKVEAVRVIGQGSATMRKQAVDSLGTIVGALPENGRNAWLADKIASEAGQAAVPRYLPKQDPYEKNTDQQAEAIQWTACMKIGVSPIKTNSQNAVTYAGTFITAGIQAINTVKQGANPSEVLRFLNICGPAAGVQLKRFANDPTRKEIFKKLSEMFGELMKLTEQLKAMVQRQQEQAQAQRKKTQQVLNDTQLRNIKVKSDIQLRSAKTQAQLQQSALKHRQQLAIADAEAASKIHRENRLAAFQTRDGED